MPKRRKKIGRPRTGHDEVLAFRAPAKMIRTLDKLAQALSMEKSEAARYVLAVGLDNLSHLLRRGRKDRAADRIAGVHVAILKAKFAEFAAKRPGRKVEAEIRAQQAAENAEELAASEGDRLARAAARRAPAASLAKPPTPPAASYMARRGGEGRRLSDHEVKNIVDRAVARSGARQ
jgi:hypothetical protein